MNRRLARITDVSGLIKVLGRWSDALRGLNRAAVGSDDFDALYRLSSPGEFRRRFFAAIHASYEENLAAATGLTAAFGPKTADIEFTAHCQLGCPFCRTGHSLRGTYPDIPRGFMSEETLARLLDQIPTLFSASLYNWGEPFLHPRLVRMVELVTERKVFCEISTNMQIMTPELADGLIASRLTHLRISCDGLTQDVYQRYRKGGDLQKVVDHSRLLADRKRAAGSMFPIMIFQMVVNKFNEHQVDEFQRFAMDCGADFSELVRLCPATPEGVDLLEEFAPTDPRYPRFTPVKSLTGCRQPWHHVSVDWNGDVYTCCSPSGFTRYKMGNVVETDFTEIWNGDRYQSARKLVRTANPDEIAPDSLACLDLCHTREFEGRWYPEDKKP